MRSHSDIDVSIFRDDAAALRRCLEGWDLQIARDGVLTPWTTGTLARPADSLWCRPDPAGPWRLQVMVDEGTPEEWVCHRHGDLRLPLDRATVRTPGGVAYLRPEIQLLLKAEETRPKDDADFAVVFPLLTAPPAAWLTDALERHHPGHRWVTNPPAPLIRIPVDHSSPPTSQEIP
jgi:hypothetical protein